MSTLFCVCLQEQLAKAASLEKEVSTLSMYLQQKVGVVYEVVGVVMGRMLCVGISTGTLLFPRPAMPRP